MKTLWNSFSEKDKPEWLTWAQIEEYERKMTEKQPKIEKAYGVLKELIADEENRFQYEMREKARMDYECRMAGALEQGLERGRSEGAEETVIKHVIQAYKKDIPLKVIADITDLTEEQVK